MCPLVVITIIVASDVFGLIEVVAKEQYPWKVDQSMKIEARIVAIISLLAPILAALQTFLRFPERAEQHKNAAVKFGILKKEVEKKIAFPPSAKEEMEKTLNNVQEHNAQIMAESPSIGSMSLIMSGFNVKPTSREEIIQKNTDKKEG